jgi:hypothetical protein
VVIEVRPAVQNEDRSTRADVSVVQPSAIHLHVTHERRTLLSGPTDARPIPVRFWNSTRDDHFFNVMMAR